MTIQRRHCSFALSNKLSSKVQKAIPDIGLYKRAEDDGGIFYAALQYLPYS